MRRATLFGQRGVRTWGSRWLPPSRSNATPTTNGLASLSRGLPCRQPVGVWSTNDALRSVPRRSIRSDNNNNNNNNNETAYPGPTRTGQADGSESTSSTARQPNKPFGQWSAQDVQLWLKSGRFAKYAESFAALAGIDLANFSKEDLQKELGNLVGSALYNEVQAMIGNPMFSGQDPQSLLSFVRWSGLMMTEGIGTPKRLANTRFMPQFVGRSETLKKTYEAFAERYGLRRGETRAPGDRLNNPMPATQSAPGGGKSRLLDIVAELSRSDLELCECEETRKILLNSVAVCITYNAMSGYSETTEGKYGASVGLAARMLWSYFMRDGTWRDFWKKIEKNLTTLPTPEDAFDCIRLHAGKPVLLCVDELTKSGATTEDRDAKLTVGQGASRSRPLDVLRELGNLLNTKPDFNVVVSTLDQLLVNQMKTDSGRKICWIPLPPLSLADSAKLFSEYREKKRKQWKAIAQCIADCNGHPRSLEYLRKVLVATPNAAWKYHSLSEQLISECLGGIILQPSEELVRFALLSHEARLTDHVLIDGVQHRVQSLIAGGALINTLEPNHRPTSPVVLRLSPLLFRTWARSGKSKLATLIERMLNVEPNFSGRSFVEFHALWELIRRELLIPPGDSSSIDISIGQLYGLNPKIGPIIRLKRKRDVVHLERNFPPSDDSSSSNINNNNNDEDALDADCLRNNVLQMWDNNAAFDLVCFEDKVDTRRGNRQLGSSIAINLQCRYTASGSSTVLNLTEMEAKRAETLDKYRQATAFLQAKQLAVTEADRLFVVVAFRKVPKSKPPPKEGYIILSKDDLVRLYGPSLASRPQFLDKEILPFTTKKERGSSGQGSKKQRKKHDSDKEQKIV